MPTIGPLEILVILVVGILVLPPDKLPEAARQVGKAIAAMRRFQSTVSKDFEQLVAQDDAPPERDPTPTLPPKATPRVDKGTRDAEDDANPDDEQSPDTETTHGRAQDDAASS